jgi:uncharacterized protein (TIGR03437 family)
MLNRIVAVALAAASICSAQKALLSDNFAQDAVLNTATWSVNTPLLTNLAVNVISTPDPNTVVTPIFSFSSAGMAMTGPNGLWQFAGIQSIQSFTPPFIVQATVQAGSDFGNSFELLLLNSDISQYVRLRGNADSVSNAYGLHTYDAVGNGAIIYATPSVETWYTATIAVDSTGNASITVCDSTGALIGQSAGLQAGTLPLFLVIAQDEFSPPVVGPAEATWNQVEVLSGNGSGSSVNVGGIVSTANYTASVAPGSIAAVFGDFLTGIASNGVNLPLPTQMFDFSLQFNGSAAPLFYVSTGQTNVQVPWEASGSVTVTPVFNSQPGTAQQILLVPYAPGIFTTNAQGTGPGAILDANYNLVSASNPVARGTGLIQIFCTGLGPVTNQPADGAPAPSSPLAQTVTGPSVTVGGVTAPMYFAGLAPGFVGLYQVDAGIPSAITAGDEVPVVISIGGATSNTVTIAVK